MLEKTRNSKRLMNRTAKCSTLGRIAPLLAGVAMMATLQPNLAEAQEVRGRLVEAVTGQPVTSGWVMLLDADFAISATAVTNQTGAFLLEAPEPGSYYVLTEALGYEPAIDGILDLGEGGSITIEFYVKPKPLVLDSLLVAVERAVIFQHLEKSGFNERLTSGFGQFITPEEIQRRNPTYFSDLFRNTPGLSLQGGSSLDGTQIQMLNASIRGSTCSPPVYVDGVLVNTDYGGLESVVDIHQIAAVEVYTRASNVPSQWGGTNAGCGVVLIWTR
jgi:hypothetical protein